MDLLEEKVRRNKKPPIQLFEEHKKQQELTNSIKRIRAFIAGNRVGKTEWGAHETTRFIHKDHPHISFTDSAVEIWACTESYDVHRDVLQPKLKKCLDPSRIVHESFIRAGIWSEIHYRADDGSIGKITFKSYDQGRKKFQGAGKKLIWFDEEPPYDIWEECTVREEAGEQLYIILTMTPLLGFTWVYDKIFLKTNDPDILVVTGGWDDNPWLTEEQKRRLESGLTEQALQVRKYGKFTRMTGLVCSWFDRGVHIREIQPKPEWDVYRIIDFGFSNPACVIYIGVDYDDNWHVFDGLYQRGLTNPQLAQAIKRKDGARYIQQCWADSESPSDIQELRDLGIDVIGIRKTSDSKESWDEYRAKILEQQGKIQGNGRPKIFISSHLVYTNEEGEEINWAAYELEHLRWGEKKIDGQTSQQPYWAPGPNHFIDTLSYFGVQRRRLEAPKPPPENPRLVSLDNQFLTSPLFQPQDPYSA